MKLVTILKTGMVALAALSVSAPVLRAYSGENFVTCNLNPNGDNFLSLRSCGSTKCEILMKLPPNTGLLAVESNSENHWREVTVRGGLQMLPIGPDGWIYDKYICPVAN